MLALVKKTRKGDRMAIGGEPIGGKGKGKGKGPAFHRIEEGDDRRPIRCDCMADRYARDGVCKHVRLLLAVADDMLAAGQFIRPDVHVKDPDALRRVLQVTSPSVDETLMMELFE